MGQRWGVFAFCMTSGGRKTFPLLSALRAVSIIRKECSRLGDSFIGEP
jgi:hypothetical protein